MSSVDADPSPLTTLAGFAAALRTAGLTVGSGQVLAYVEASARVDLSSPDELYWAGRACLVCRHEDLATYDAVFRGYFGAGRAPITITMTVTGELPRSAPSLPSPAEVARTWSQPSPEQEARAGTRASSAEVLRHKRFTECTPEELEAVRVLMSRLRITPPQRRTRRTSPSRRGRDHDLRRTIHRSLRSHGEPLHRAWRSRRTRPRRVILLLDVSASMAGYSRALLQFAHVAAPGTEVFCFGTRTTRLTHQLRTRDLDRALAAAAEAVVDWEGGTRIGEALRTFLRIWGRRGMARGAVVVICSDGLERDDPALLAAQMERLARLTHRVVWVNPLKGDPRYQPVARGMRAALPFVDVFVPGHDLSSLEVLAGLLADLAQPQRTR